MRNCFTTSVVFLKRIYNLSTKLIFIKEEVYYV